MGKFSWGQLKAKVSGLKDWRAHDATQTWTDDGDAERLLADFLPKMQAVISENVKVGVAEYAASGEYALSVRDGTLWVDLHIWNDLGRLVVGAPIRDLLNQAIAEAYTQIGASPDAQEFMSHISKLAIDLNKLTQVTPARQPTAQGQGGQIARGPRRVATA